MKIKRLWTLIVVLLLMTSCAPSFDKQLSKGSELARQGKLTEAEQILLGLVEKYSDESQPYLKLADIYLEEGEADKAINIVKKGLEVAEDQDNLNLKIGQIYLSLPDIHSAKKHLIQVEEKSGQLAVNLLKVASDSNDIGLLDKTFNDYKDMDMVGENHEFLECALLAYSKSNDYEVIEEVINIAAQQTIKLDPAVIVEAYNTLLSLDMKELADYIIEQEIYNREIGDLSLIPQMTKDHGNKVFINLTSGYFTSPDRLDIALLYGLDDGGYYSSLEIRLVNGLTGELIANHQEESISAYMHIGTFNVDGNKDQLLSVSNHAGGSGTPSNVGLYRVSGEVIQKISYTPERDREIVFLDHFEYEIKSNKLGISYLLQLPLEYIPYYVSEGFYSKEGKFLAPESRLGGGYEHRSVVSNLVGGDYMLESVRLWDTIENNAHIGYVKTFYRFEEDKLVMVDLSVEDEQAKAMPFNYNEGDGYEKFDAQELASKKEELEKTLSFYLDLLDETENTIKAKFGEPLLEGDYGVRYIEYDDFIAFVNDFDRDQEIDSLWILDLGEIKNDKDFMINQFGLPDESGYDKEEMNDYMTYLTDNYVITLANVQGVVPYIRIKKAY